MKKKKSRKAKRVFICPLCLKKFNTMKEVIEHQNMSGHVFDGSGVLHLSFED